MATSWALPLAGFQFGEESGTVIPSAFPVFTRKTSPNAWHSGKGAVGHSMFLFVGHWKLAFYDRKKNGSAA